MTARRVNSRHRPYIPDNQKKLKTGEKGMVVIEFNFCFPVTAGLTRPKSSLSDAGCDTAPVYIATSDRVTATEHSEVDGGHKISPIDLG